MEERQFENIQNFPRGGQDLPGEKSDSRFMPRSQHAFLNLRHCWLWLAVLVSLELVSSAAAEVPDRWRAYPNVGLLGSVTLRIHWFDSTDELREAAQTSGQDINEIGLNGFSILKRNTKTGDYVCDLYVVRMTGAQIDGDRTTTFGHEVLHCFGLSHE